MATTAANRHHTATKRRPNEGEDAGTAPSTRARIRRRRSLIKDEAAAATAIALSARLATPQ